MCDVCQGDRYLFSVRDDGLVAIERCDACSADTMSDEDAAKLAQATGVVCASRYPCYVTSDSRSLTNGN